MKHLDQMQSADEAAYIAGKLPVTKRQNLILRKILDGITPFSIVYVSNFIYFLIIYLGHYYPSLPIEMVIHRCQLEAS